VTWPEPITESLDKAVALEVANVVVATVVLQPCCCPSQTARVRSTLRGSRTLWCGEVRFDPLSL
jgi:hypothetical protein